METSQAAQADAGHRRCSIPKIVVPAIGQAFVKLDPRTLMKNPVMFVLEIVTALTTVLLRPRPA